MKKHVRGAGRKRWGLVIVFGLFFVLGIGFGTERNNRTVHVDGTKWNGLCG